MGIEQKVYNYEKWLTEHTGETLCVVAIARPTIIHHNSPGVRRRRTSIHVNVCETLHLLAKEMTSCSLT